MSDYDAKLRINTAFELVCEMEEDLQRVENLARALMMMGGYFGEDHAAPLIDVARHITEHAKTLENRRDALFRLLRPHSAHHRRGGSRLDEQAA